MEEHHVSSTISTCYLFDDCTHHLQAPVSCQLSAHCVLQAHWARLRLYILQQEVSLHRYLKLYSALTYPRTVPLGGSSHVFVNPIARILHDRLDLCRGPGGLDSFGSLCRWSPSTSSCHCQRFLIYTTKVARSFVLLGYSVLCLCTQCLGSQSPAVAQYCIR
jgi:hypothetical protein